MAHRGCEVTRAGRGGNCLSALIDKFVRADLGRRLYGLLPERKLERLPEPPLRGLAGTTAE